MRMQRELLRLSTLLATAALLAAAPLAPGAWAQPALPPLAPAPGAQTTADPPARVGRLALVTGSVSFHTQADTDWSPATLNYPVAAGNSFWTQPDAEADLELGGTRIDMAATTEVDLNTLDVTGTNATLPQGEVYIHIRALLPNETVTLETPRGTVTIATPGLYGIIAGDDADPTVITVITGAAQVAVGTTTLDVGPTQAATITGTDADSFAGSVGPATQDAFVAAMIVRERPPPPPPNSAPPPPAVADLPGGTDLTTTGIWSTSPTYGQVWYPPVAANWVPYRDGHWAYVAPWGWTWVDAAPWGFAPFHYGRWAHIGNRWGWIPGVEAHVGARPVYAPALVTFFGVGAAGVGVGVAIGASVGWCPLGPNEVYHPWYHATPQYVRNVNVANVRNVTNITTINNTTINNYHNARFATMVPATALAQSRPVAAMARPVSAQQLAAARPVVTREPVRPTAATAGVTPAMARQLHIATAPGTAAPRTAPGPAVHPVAPAVAGHPAIVPLRPATTPAAARPGVPVTHPAEPAKPPTAATPAHPTPAVAQPGAAAHPAAPVEHPAATPHTPAPAPAAHPAAAPHPAAVEHPAATPHTPAPAPAAHPAAAAAPPPTPHPAPAAHPAPPPHPSSPPRPEEKKPGQP